MIQHMFLPAIVLCCLTGTTALAGEATLSLTDIAGITHLPFEEKAVRAVALVFITTDCPIANSYQPQLRRMAKNYESAGIRMFMIHPNPSLTTEQAKQHAQEYQIEVPVVIDRNQALAKRVDAAVTPEVVVLARGREEPVYQGRIDDRYANYGKKRVQATQHDLANALDSIREGALPKVSRTKPIGCFISYSRRAE